MLSLTSHCNLRCVYCGHSRPGRRFQDLDLQIAYGVAEEVLARGCRSIAISGDGETTVRRDWVDIADRLLAAGARLSLITNLCRCLSDREIDALSRFGQISISVDTVDPDLFAELRRNGDFLTVLYNMGRIRARALANGTPPPFLSWDACVNNRTVFGLPQLVLFGLAQGVGNFSFNQLQVPLGLGFRDTAYPVSEMPRADVEKLHGLFEGLYALIRASGGSYVVQGSLLEAIAGGGDETSGVPEEGRCSKTAAEDRTRDCLFPWSKVFVKEDATVKPCCYAKPIGSLREASLAEMLNGPEMARFRHELWTGALREECAMCYSRPWTTISRLRRNVSLFLTRNR